MRRIGVFGGSFNPIHLGHLVVAEQCREAGRLDEVWFLPAGSHPFRPELKDFDRRVDMLELALAGNPAFRVEPIEKDLPRPTFTSNTLAELHRRHPGDELHFLIGSDLLTEMPRWHEPHRIIASAGLLVMQRPGHPVLSSEQLRGWLSLSDEVPLRLEYVPSPPLIDISSTDLRQRIATGRSIRYLVPRSVECYIADKGLYRDGTS